MLKVSCRGGALALLLCYRSAAAAGGEAVPSIWPQPTKVVSGSQTATVDPTSFGCTVHPVALDVTDAFDRYREIFFPHSVAPSQSAAGGGLSITLLNTSTALELITNESYTLDVTADGTASIVAATQYAALRGIETLSQLIKLDFQKEQYVIPGVPLHIEDAPRFAHRGILIDSGRHFEPLRQVKALIDSMAYAKFNVLHWHLTEDQSFPIASRVFPELTQKGAFDEFEQYTAADIAELVEYARLRAIRVIPEFDMPGHSASWRNSHPEIFTSSCKTGRGAFDPANNATFKMLEAALKDWTSGMFSDDFLHLGTDEVPTACWNNTKDLEWMKTMGFADDKAVFNYFVNTIHDIAVRLGKQPIFWDEAFISAQPPKDSIIQNWHDATLTKEIVEAGHRAIYSPNGGYTHGWYLDGLGSTWQAMYALDPRSNISADIQERVIGGEGCMWGERVDPSDLEFTIWPRAAAIAERLWSAADVTDVEGAEARLQDFRCKLLERGVHAGHVGGRGRDAPQGPGPCSQTLSSTSKAKSLFT